MRPRHLCFGWAFAAIQGLSPLLVALWSGGCAPAIRLRQAEPFPAARSGGALNDECGCRRSSTPGPLPTARCRRFPPSTPWAVASRARSSTYEVSAPAQVRQLRSSWPLLSDPAGFADAHRFMLTVSTYTFCGRQRMQNDSQIFVETDSGRARLPFTVHGRVPAEPRHLRSSASLVGGRLPSHAAIPAAVPTMR